MSATAQALALPRTRAAAQGLRRSARRLLFAWLGASVVTLVPYGVMASHNGFHVYPNLKTAYLSTQERSGLPPTKAAAVQDIKVVLPGFKVIAARDHQQAYDEVRAVKGPAVAVATLGRGHIELIGRLSQWYSAVSEIDGDQNGHYSTRTLWTGNMRWTDWLKTSGEEGAVLLLLLLGLAGREARRAGAQLRRRKQWEGERLARWHEVVPEPVYGPQAPEDGFEIFVPEFEERQGKKRAVFEAVPHFWDDERWYPGHIRVPKEIARVEIAQGASLEEISSRWTEFCYAVATVNAARWDEEQKRREEKRRRDAQAAEARRREEERKQIEQVNLKELLQPGTKMVRGLLSPEEGR